MALVLPTFEGEVVSTIGILMAAAGAGVKRVVLAGSLEEPDGDAPPSSPYAAAKVASRNYARMFHLLYATPVVLTRIFMCYGPGQPSWKFIPSTIEGLLDGKRPVVASPDRAVDWLYVSDAVAGLLAAARVPSLEGKSIDIGSGELTTIREVVEKLAALIDPSVEPEYASAAQRMHERIRRADVDETFRLTGWKPAVSLDRGLEWTAESFRPVAS
jgi:nucleoside-diphosphate-sugar epimerase